MDQEENKNNKVIIVGISLIALVFAYTILKSTFTKDEPKGSKRGNSGIEITFPKITPEDLRGRLKNNNDIKLADIRMPDDYKLEHLIGSTNVTSEEFLNGVSQEKTIVFIGYEDQKEANKEAVDFAKEKGFKDVYVLDGSISAWKEIGGSTISIGNPGSFIDNAKIIYISPEDLKKIIDNQEYPKYILDVSSKQVFNSGHIVGADNIFLDDLEKSADKIPAGKETIVYGETDLQGFQSGVRLYDLGLMNIKVLKGGMPAWKDKGFEVVK